LITTRSLVAVMDIADAELPVFAADFLALSMISVFCLLLWCCVLSARCFCCDAMFCDLY
jgi:hypothetical protein